MAPRKRKQQRARSPRETRTRFIEGPQVPGHVVQHSDTHHLVLIDGVIISCTPTEYLLLLHLLQQVGQHVPYSQLLRDIYPGTQTRSSRRLLAHYISSVRAKVWPFGFDILCITSFGYTLEPKPTTTEN